MAPASTITISTTTGTSTRDHETAVSFEHPRFISEPLSTTTTRTIPPHCLASGRAGGEDRGILRSHGSYPSSARKRRTAPTD